MEKTPYLLFILLLVFSCKKPDERACLKKSGDNTKRIINPGDFSRIYLKEHLNYLMIQDTANYVVVDGGENLVGFVNCSIDGNELVISNENKCKFLRYKTGKITVEIHFINLTSLVYQGTELLTNRNNWNFNQINIDLKDAVPCHNSNFSDSKLSILGLNNFFNIFSMLVPSSKKSKSPNLYSVNKFGLMKKSLVFLL